MEVDGIEILRMARDDELKPKTILKTKDINICGDSDYYIYYEDNRFHRCDENGKLGAKYQNRFLNYEVLNKEFELILPIENKEIEKIQLPTFEEFKNMSVEEQYLITAKEYDLLDELIDEINKLKRSDK